MLNDKIVTLSFDDNKINDMRFADTLDKYGIKCTFNVNSVSIGREGHIDKIFLRELANRHEIASHTVSHTQFLPEKDIAEIRRQVVDDKKAIEDMIGRKIYGFAYPYGQYSDKMIGIVKEAGLVYARTIDNTYSFDFECENFYTWHPTCHQEKACGLIGKWKECGSGLFYIWGHSREFCDDWNKLDELLSRLKDVEGVKCLTNIEVYNMINNKKSTD